MLCCQACRCFLLSVGDIAAQLDELNAMGLMGSRGTMGQVATFNCQRQGGHNYHNCQFRQKSRVVVACCSPRFVSPPASIES